VRKKLSQFSSSSQQSNRNPSPQNNDIARQLNQREIRGYLSLGCVGFIIGSGHHSTLFFFMPRHKAGGNGPLSIWVGLFIPLSLCFNLCVFIQFHVRERGMMQLLPKEDYLGHDIVGLNPPPQPQSVRENTSERGFSEKTRIMQKRQNGFNEKTASHH
jgi:hypothetical protein